MSAADTSVFVTEEIKEIIQQGCFRQIPLDSIVIVDRPTSSKDRAETLFFNPRSSQGFDPVSMAELESAIATDGLLQPIGVRDRGDETYDLIWGERRLRAIRGLVDRDEPVRFETDGEMHPASQVYSSVMCRILLESECDDERALRLAWIENDNRVALSNADVFDLCYRLQSLKYERKQICELLKQPASWLSHTFAFKEKLPPQVYQMLREGEISRSYAIKILEQPQEMRDDLARLAQEIAVERFEATLEEIAKEKEIIEEELVEAETAVAIADDAPPEVKQQAKKDLKKVVKAAEQVEAKEVKVRTSGVNYVQSDVEEAAKRKGLSLGKGLPVKVIFTQYINCSDDLLKTRKDPKTGKKFLPRDLEIAKLIATGIAHGEKDFISILRKYYNENNLWDGATAETPEICDNPDWDDPQYLLDDDEENDEDLDEIDDDDDEDLDSLDDLDLD